MRGRPRLHTRSPPRGPPPGALVRGVEGTSTDRSAYYRLAGCAPPSPHVGGDEGVSRNLLDLETRNTRLLEDRANPIGRIHVQVAASSITDFPLPGQESPIQWEAEECSTL